MTEYEMTFILVIIIISLTVIRYISHNGMFGVFAGVVSFFAAIHLSLETHNPLTESTVPLAIVFALLGVWLIYDGVWGRS